MSTIVLGCDRNNGNDSKIQNGVAKVLEKAGHKVEKLSIGPNAFASYSYSNKAKGKIGVFLIASGITALADLYDGNTKFKYGYIVIRGDLQLHGLKTLSEFNSSPIHKDKHGDCISKSCNSFDGKTYPEMNKVTKDKVLTVYGTTADEMGNAVITAMGGSTDSSSSSSDSSSGSSSIKEAIQKLLKHWDGEVECRIIDDEVYINKVREPQSEYTLLLQEGLNVYSDSISITDVNPDTVNYLVVHWSEGKITIKDEELISRFGTIRKDVNAVKKTAKVVKKTTTTTSDDDSDEDDEDTGNEKTTIVNVPIKKYKEALKFANIEWNKLKRDNGHTIECQVTGSGKWRTGEWVKVVFPSFNENGYMYITRASHSDSSGDWNCNLTLADYPPGWGVEESSNSSSSSSGTSNISSIINKIVKEISKFSYSGSCSAAACIKSTKKGDCHALSDYIYTRLKNEGVSVRIYQYVTGSANNHRQVKYKDGSNWVMFPYAKSGIDHTFYTNSIPSNAEIYKSG